MPDRAEFEKDAAGYLERLIKDFVATSPKNQLRSFNNEPIFDEPLVGFADGDDPIFEYYKVVALESIMTPREVMARHLKSQGIEQEPPHLSVISFVMPITAATRVGLRQQDRVPTLRWNHTRWEGQALIQDLVAHLVATLEGMGYRAIAPEQSPFFELMQMPTGQTSNWSQRHVAYAAGLGTFSITDGLITPKGIAMRLGSVVTDAVIPASPRTYAHHMANCLFFRGESCRRCMERCPAGAITASGHDKIACRKFVNQQGEILKQMGQDLSAFQGRYPGCGLCQTKIPCESMIPPPGRGAD